MKKIIFLLAALPLSIKTAEIKTVTGYIALKTKERPELGEYQELIQRHALSFDPKIELEEHFNKKLSPETLLFAVNVWNKKNKLTTYSCGYPHGIKYLFPRFLDFDTIKNLKEGEMLVVSSPKIRYQLIAKQKEETGTFFQEALKEQVEKALEGNFYIIQVDLLIKNKILEQSSQYPSYLLTEKYQEPLRKYLEENSLRNKNN